MRDLKKSCAISCRKLSITFRNVQGNAVAGALELIAGGCLLSKRINQNLRPSCKLEGALINFQLLVVEHRERRGRGRLFWQKGDDYRGEEDVHQSDLEKENPAEPHQLVVA